MIGELRILKGLSELELTPYMGGYVCRKTECYINSEMVKLFDGCTLRKFELYDDKDRDTDDYRYKSGNWAFNEHWFVPEEPEWLAEEDFAL